MSTTNTKKTTKKAKTTSTPKLVVDDAVVEEVEIVTTRPVTAKRVEVDLNDIVYVQSCFHGNLFYKSKRNGSIVEWQTFAEEQPMSVDELMYMRNTQPTFFKEQWVRLVGENADDVFAFLHLDRYCKNNLKFDDFDDVFEMNAEEIEATVKEFTASLKESFARRAKELYDAGELNNLKVIKAIERATKFKLLE